MYSDYQKQTPIVINDRSSEGLADANIRIGNMLSEMTELQIKLQAMYLVMLDQGIDPQVFEDKIEEVMKARGNKKPVSLDSKPCPKCGRMVKKSSTAPLLGKCLYCGSNVSFAPTFLNVEKEDEEPQEPKEF